MYLGTHYCLLFLINITEIETNYDTTMQNYVASNQTTHGHTSEANTKKIWLTQFTVASQKVILYNIGTVLMIGSAE